MVENGKIISLQQWRFKKVETDMANRIATDDDAYFEKNQTLEELCKRQTSFKPDENVGERGIYDKGVWDGIELAKQIINEFI